MIKSRRQCTRTKRSVETNREQITRLTQEFNNAKTELKKAINKSKRESWWSLIDEIENNPFGEGYKIAVKSMKTTRGDVEPG